MRTLIMTLAALAVGLASVGTATAQPVKVLKPNTWLVPTGHGSVVPLPYWNPNGPLKVAIHPQPQPTRDWNRVLLNPQPLPPRWRR